MSTKERVVIVTGCSDGGIGAALCEAFVAQGCVVYATARRVEAMSELRSRAAVRPLQLDVTDEASVRRAVETVAQETGGRIDVLVNNAGVGLVAPLAEVDTQEARMLYDTNVWGLLAMVQAVFPHMAARRSGTIVNIGSVVGYVPVPWGGIYASSKAAVHSLTDVMRLELAPYGIKTVLIAPGAIRSNIGRHNLDRFNESSVKLYSPFMDTLRERTQLSQTPKSTDTHWFAKKVVAQVLKRSPPRHYMLGYMVGLIRLAMVLPMWLRDRMTAKRFKLNVVLGPPALPAPPASAAGAGSSPPLLAAGASSSGAVVDKKGQ